MRKLIIICMAVLSLIFLLSFIAVADETAARTAEQALQNAKKQVTDEFSKLNKQIEQWDRLAKLLNAVSREELADIPEGDELISLAARAGLELSGLSNREIVGAFRELKDELDKEGFFEALEQAKGAARTVKAQMDRVNTAVEFYEVVMLFEPETGGPADAFDRFTKVIDGPVSKMAQKIPGIGGMFKFYAESCKEIGTAFHRLERTLAINRPALCGSNSPEWRIYRDQYYPDEGCPPYLRNWSGALHPIRAYDEAEGHGNVFLYLNDSALGHTLMDRRAFNILHRAYRVLREEGRVYYVDPGRLEQAVTPERFMQIAEGHVRRQVDEIITRDEQFERWFKRLGRPCFATLLQYEGKMDEDRIIAGEGFRYFWSHAQSTGQKYLDEFKALCLFYGPFQSHMNSLMSSLGDQGLIGGYIQAKDGKPLKDLKVTVGGLSPDRIISDSTGKRYHYFHRGKVNQEVQVVVRARGYEEANFTFTPKRGGAKWEYAGDCFTRRNVTLNIADETHVPAVIGMNQPAAKKTIDQTGLVAAVTTANHDTMPAGQVISQEPSAGEVVETGSVVAIKVSLGPELFDDFGKTAVNQCEAYCKPRGNDVEYENCMNDCLRSVWDPSADPTDDKCPLGGKWGRWPGGTGYCCLTYVIALRGGIYWDGKPWRMPCCVNQETGSLGESCIRAMTPAD
ncbi:PASTA domain-containing protein [Desulfobulbus alkaliphilus]|uniref:PASTA domain-containing protein n=1 Tax=Desulfobulbus alkaliphilus TaxID=869814 RepID=UPI0019624756|nr:PASTA domain-containing protein [Desulfobulbus alkaliphilus]MBM9538539.1 PASTA domain-containing protein [Desulfobulbus alkaliphilus]